MCSEDLLEIYEAHAVSPSCRQKWDPVLWCNRGKLLLATLASHFGGLLVVLAAPLPIHVPANASRKAADDGSST